MTKLELEIAWRYLRSRRGSRLLSLISVIAIGGVLVGVSALIVIMGVMNGLVRMIIGTSEQNFSDGARMLLNPQDFKTATGLAEPLATAHPPSSRSAPTPPASTPPPRPPRPRASCRAARTPSWAPTARA